MSSLNQVEFQNFASDHSDYVPNHRYEFPSHRFCSIFDLTCFGTCPVPVATGFAPLIHKKIDQTG